MAVPMHVFALTGGIATGKSTFVRTLGELLPEAVVFDCDASVGRWLSTAEVVEEAARHHSSALVRGHAAWALGRIAGPNARATLKELADDDPDSSVRDEAAAALLDLH